MPEVRTTNEIFMLRPDVVVTTLENEAILLDLDSKFFYSTNLAGWAIVQLFEGGTTRAQVADRCRDWAVAEEQGAAVASFVDYLIAERLVAPSSSTQPSPHTGFPSPWQVPTIEKFKEPLQRIMISAFDPTLPLAE